MAGSELDLAPNTLVAAEQSVAHAQLHIMNGKVFRKLPTSFLPALLQHAHQQLRQLRRRQLLCQHLCKCQNLHWLMAHLTVATSLKAGEQRKSSHLSISAGQLYLRASSRLSRTPPSVMCRRRLLLRW